MHYLPKFFNRFSAFYIHIVYYRLDEKKMYIGKYNIVYYVDILSIYSQPENHFVTTHNTHTHTLI